MRAQIALAAALAACGGQQTPVGNDAGSPTGSSDVGTTASAPNEDTTAIASTGSEGGGGGDASSTQGDGATETGTTGTTGEPDVPRWAQLIRASPYPRLVIEVDYVTGRAPRPANITQIEAVMMELLDKPGGVEVVLDEELPEGDPDQAWTHQMRSELAQATSNLAVPDDTIKLHAIFVGGHAAEDDEGRGGVLLGVAWAYENIVMFRDTMDAGCEALAVGPLVDQLCAEAELLIWQHEIGHTIGLVDNGMPMIDDHRDPDPKAGAHDVSQDCVMYRSYEAGDALEAILDRIIDGAPPLQMGPQCRADVQAVIDG